jgi:hypothetical protein
VCATVRGNREWKSPPGVLYVDGRPWSVVSCDLVKGMGPTKILLIAVCMYTRYLQAVILRSESASAIVKALGGLFLAEGPCRVLVTDNAKALTGKEMEGFLTDLKIQHKLVPRYSGFYGGWYERQHATLVKVLSCLTPTGNGWEKKLQLAVFYTNLRPFDESTSGTGEVLSPFEVFKGRIRPKLVDQLMKTDQPLPTDEQVMEGLSVTQEELQGIRDKYEEVWKLMRQERFLSMKDKSHGRVAEFSVGDRVYVWIPKLLQNKIGSRWEGPYNVESKVTESGTIWMVNGKAEHAYNMKPIDSSAV